MRPPINYNQDADRIAARLRAMFGMYEVGIDMLRCRLRREMPGATSEEIRAEIAAYLQRDRWDKSKLFKKRTCSRFSVKS